MAARPVSSFRNTDAGRPGPRTDPEQRGSVCQQGAAVLFVEPPDVLSHSAFIRPSLFEMTREQFIFVYSRISVDNSPQSQVSWCTRRMRPHRRFVATLALAVAMGHVHPRAQAPAGDSRPIAFEVASIKPNASRDAMESVSLQSGGRLRMTGFRLRHVDSCRVCLRPDADTRAGHRRAGVAQLRAIRHRRQGRRRFDVRRRRPPAGARDRDVEDAHRGPVRRQGSHRVAQDPGVRAQAVAP